MSASIGIIAESHQGFGGGGYSSVVHLFLEIDGARMPLTQVGDGEMYFAKPVKLPSKPATLVIKVDDEVSVRPILIVGNLEPSTLVRFE